MVHKSFFQEAAKWGRRAPAWALVGALMFPTSVNLGAFWDRVLATHGPDEIDALGWIALFAGSVVVEFVGSFALVYGIRLIALTLAGIDPFGLPGLSKCAVSPARKTAQGT